MIGAKKATNRWVLFVADFFLIAMASSLFVLSGSMPVVEIEVAETSVMDPTLVTQPLATTIFVENYDEGGGYVVKGADGTENLSGREALRRYLAELRGRGELSPVIVTAPRSFSQTYLDALECVDELWEGPTISIRRPRFDP